LRGKQKKALSEISSTGESSSVWREPSLASQSEWEKKTKRRTGKQFLCKDPKSTTTTGEREGRVFEMLGRYGQRHGIVSRRKKEKSQRQSRAEGLQEEKTYTKEILGLPSALFTAARVSSRVAIWWFRRRVRRKRRWHKGWRRNERGEKGLYDKP